MPSVDEPCFFCTSSRGSVFRSSFASGFIPSGGFVLFDFAISTSALISGDGTVGVLRFAILAAARGLVAGSPVIQRFLRRPNVGLLPFPNFHSRVLNGARKRKSNRPGQFVFEPDIHGVQPRRGQFAWLTAG